MYDEDMLRRLTEQNYRSLFRATVILKGLFALGEVLVGFLLMFMSYKAIYGAIAALAGDELTDHPLDPLWRYAAHGLRGFTATPPSVWSFIFLSHGAIKLVLVAALLKEKMWAYPLGIAVFGCFIVYQAWQMAYTPSMGLLFITLVDVVVVGLIIHEYRWRLRH